MNAVWVGSAATPTSGDGMIDPKTAQMEMRGPPQVQQLVIHLNNEIVRAFTPPPYLARCPNELAAFQHRAWDYTKEIREQLFDLTNRYLVPVAFVPLHGMAKRAPKA